MCLSEYEEGAIITKANYPAWQAALDAVECGDPRFEILYDNGRPVAIRVKWTLLTRT